MLYFTLYKLFQPAKARRRPNIQGCISPDAVKPPNWETF
jgi:hypothetical protein